MGSGAKTWARVAPALVVPLLVAMPSALAEWQLTRPAGGPDATSVSAEVSSRSGDAVLRYVCRNGAPLLSLDVERDFARGLVETTITFDNRRPQPILLQVFSNPRSLPLVDLSLTDVSRAKRLRLDLTPIEAAPVSYEFDTRGGRKAMSAVSCGGKKRSFFRRLSQDIRQSPAA